jgi:hypothetical protein
MQTIEQLIARAESAEREVERLKHGTVAQFKDAFIDELKRENMDLRASSDEHAKGYVENRKRIAAMESEIDRLHARNAVLESAKARAERAEAELAAAKLLLNEETDCAEAVEAAIVRQYARAERAEREVERLTAQRENLLKPMRDQAIARAERAEAEVQRLKSDGAASAFIVMSCRASRAETDRNNLRADLDAIKAILTEEKARAERAEAELSAAKLLLNEETDCAEVVEAAIVRQYARAERAEAELATERARLRDLWCEMALEYRDERISYVSVQITRSVWDELDAAMKEDAK